MRLALLTGQPFSDLLSWHPRDVDTAWQAIADAEREQQERARDARFEAARKALLQKGW